MLLTFFQLACSHNKIMLVAAESLKMLFSLSLSLSLSLSHTHTHTFLLSNFLHPSSNDAKSSSL